jgi:hypothetical protein
VVEKPEQQDALFVNLVLIFQNAAMQQMGKIANPMTGKIERSLEQARFSIDMIDMLRSKTRGNLSSDLERLLDTTLTNLRMNYVDEVNKQTSEEGEAKDGEGPEKKEAADAGGPGREEGTAGDKGTEGEKGAGGRESTDSDGDTGESPEEKSDRGSESGGGTEDEDASRA